MSIVSGFVSTVPLLLLPLLIRKDTFGDAVDSGKRTALVLVEVAIPFA